jgi:sigma-B regulation protein RsbU (phosphoserine phosphatase)
VGERRLGIAVGDVVGKGVPAALLMSNLQAAVRALAPDVRLPQQLAGRVNRLVAANTSARKFITLFYGVLEDRRLTYTNAGHNPPMLVKAGGEVCRLECGGLVLGVLPEWRYEQSQVTLAPGDRLLLFSDGISEAENRAGAQFGEERLLELLVNNRGLDATRLRKKIMTEVAEFTSGAPQDDTTLVAIAVE